ncbi:hypothetical protein HZF05_03730 [Sphingomonas sp. CGMCC 1.13654]|uniref:Diguanylate cyclase n=1 Tax=Sphingomonas chungangi TaxID=2683589 RepID=A0A838L2P0_9SPHN|nr:hypothetical protein [Sphingomonas chungangi]MVW57872.1 hypothetical protein [Sphingomonas chungangi]
MPLTHSWPLFESEQRFDLGMTFNGGDVPPIMDQLRPIADVGRWECDLSDNRLAWSPAVYALFGLPIGTAPVREAVLPFYEEGSRALMERLRAYAIRHRRGFTLDAELRPADGGRRWMRLVAAPVIEDGRVVRLLGLKRDLASPFT